MKKLFFISAIALISFATNAQSKKQASSGGTSFSLGLEAGIPIGQYPKGFSNPFSFVLGGSLQLEQHVAPDLGLTLSGGYLSYSVKSDYRAITGRNSSGIIPLLAGVKYYFSPGVYGHGQLGAAFATAQGGGTSFAYSPGIGFNISPNLDAELKYTGISNKAATLGSVGIRLAYNF